MGLFIDKDTNSGAKATYHKIIGLSIDYNQARFTVTVGGYYSKVARAAGYDPMISWSVSGTFDGVELTRAVLYDTIKSDPLFIGAIDDL